jgi:hypothetical protein
MPRMTFTQSLFGVVALTALVGTGCDQWLKALAEAQAQGNGDSTGKGTGGSSTGTGGAPANAGSAGAPGAAVSCKAVVNASGATCKECVDATGAIVYEACDSVPVGSGGTGGTGPATDPGACITLSDGGPTSCKDAATWMKYGAQACAQQNLTLTDLKPVTTCAGGNYESVTYVCCGSAPPSDAGTTAPVITCAQTPAAGGGVCQTCTDQTGKVVKTDCPDGSPNSGSGGSGGSTGTGGGACTSIDDGGPTSCKDQATWKQYGIDRCAQQNLSLTDLKPQTMCAGGYASVTYVCCG